jgi:hypothetical protein
MPAPTPRERPGTIITGGAAAPPDLATAARYTVPTAKDLAVWPTAPWAHHRHRVPDPGASVNDFALVDLRSHGELLLREPPTTSSCPSRRSPGFPLADKKSK